MLFFALHLFSELTAKKLPIGYITSMIMKILKIPERDLSNYSLITLNALQIGHYSPASRA